MLTRLSCGTQSHVEIHRHIRRLTDTHTQVNLFTHPRTHTCTHTQTHIHRCVHGGTHKHARITRHRHTYTHVCVGAHTHTHILLHSNPLPHALKKERTRYGKGAKHGALSESSTQEGSSTLALTGQTCVTTSYHCIMTALKGPVENFPTHAHFLFHMVSRQAFKHGLWKNPV